MIDRINTLATAYGVAFRKPGELSRLGYLASWGDRFPLMILRDQLADEFPCGAGKLQPGQLRIGQVREGERGEFLVTLQFPKEVAQ